MDVTFLENVPYYPKTHIQGENSVSQEEYQFWDIPTLDIPQRLPQSHSQLDVESFQSDIQPSDPSLIQGGNKELKDKELKVYSRHQKNPKPVEPHMHPEPCQTDVPSPTPTEVIQGNDEEEISKLKMVLSREFEIKDLGTLRYFLGMEVARSGMVSMVSQFMNNPTKEHQEAVYRILRYLKMTPGRGLFFKKGVSRGVEIFSDADWAGSLSDRRSTSAISIAKNPVHQDRTKHIEIDRHFIKEKIEQGVIEVDYTPTWQQTADVLTKAIPRVCDVQPCGGCVRACGCLYSPVFVLQNDLIGQFDELPTCKSLWDQLKFSFGGTSTTWLRSLVIKFEYTKDPKHTMSEHLRMMSNMINKLRDAGHALTDEQQVRAVIRSLPASWANMKQILTHSENIKNFSDVSQHVILEAETRDADKALTYVTQEGSRNANGKRGR
ncbi:hypothetical protein RJ640_027163 [Escallonia rubra]|uniref:Uncharacterized protein n=1 Tax=Escallonia rubra TaxID=112253 RepID=A0AA88U3Y4_9ASTE|nr:hypothetical protein RJ640_027163 [Escallonia rubra]